MEYLHSIVGGDKYSKEYFYKDEKYDFNVYDNDGYLQGIVNKNNNPHLPEDVIIKVTEMWPNFCVVTGVERSLSKMNFISYFEFGSLFSK